MAGSFQCIIGTSREGAGAVGVEPLEAAVDPPPRRLRVTACRSTGRHGRPVQGTCRAAASCAGVQGARGATLLWDLVREGGGLGVRSATAGLGGGQWRRQWGWTWASGIPLLCFWVNGSGMVISVFALRRGRGLRCAALCHRLAQITVALLIVGLEG